LAISNLKGLLPVGGHFDVGHAKLLEAAADEQTAGELVVDD
jgi:hypothetical protein